MTAKARVIVVERCMECPHISPRKAIFEASAGWEYYCKKTDDYLTNDVDAGVASDCPLMLLDDDTIEWLERVRRIP